MKGMKKLLSILMVLTLVLSLGATAFAEESSDGKVTVTLPEAYASHKMVAYQIFEGAQADGVTSQGQLGVTGWAEGVDSTGLLGALSTAYPDGGFSADMNAVAAAKAIGDLSKTPGFDAAQFAKNIKSYITSTNVPFKGLSAELPSGYWIIVDDTPKENQDTGFAYSAYLLQVVGTEGVIPVTPKFAAPKVDKEVQDQNDSSNADPTWGEVADWDIGDDVPFQIIATMPSTLEGYTSYKLVLHDTMSSGLTLDQSSIKVFVNDSEDAIPMAGNWAVAPGENGTFTVTIKNVMEAPFNAKAGDKIKVTYNAKLNENAVIGGTGNPNEVYLEYSNNPNVSDDTGKTPPNKVVVFTFKLNVDKVKPAPTDDDPNATDPLAGAVFTLQKKNAEGAWEDVDTVGYKPGSTEPDGTTLKFEFKGLDEGEYKIVETVVPDGYNKADDIEFKVAAEYTTNETGTTVKSLTISDGEGNVISGDGKLFATNTSTGVIDTDVVNSSGVELPETGGIGTTIFYVVGAVLVAAAVVLLVTKRRVNGAEK